MGQILLGLKEYKDDSDAKRMIKDLTKVVESGQDYYSKISSSLRRNTHWQT
ncbi:MAG: hypothetical protein LBP51_04400 [Deferribacteraceae bacterium]|nr:hypothetical protein [Deferribacteraceae bacterium]